MTENFLNQHRYRILIGIILLSSWVYFPSLQNGFAVDDFPAHVDNELVKGGVKNIPELFRHNFYYGYDQRVEANEYRPVASSFFALQYSLFGEENPMAMHGVSILLSAITLVLIFLLTRSLWGIRIALLSTMLFALMPVHSEVILNIKSQDDLLFTLFLLLSFYLWMEKAKSRYFFLATIVSFSFALFSKEAAIGAVFLFPALDYLRDKKINPATAWFLAPVLFYLAIRKGVLTPLSEGDVINNALHYTDSIGTQSAMAFAFFLRYLLWMVYPPYLSWDYSYNHIELHGWMHWESVIGLLLFVGGLVWMVLLVKKRNQLFWPLLLLYSGIGIYLQLFLKIDATFGERFSYYPSLGIAILMASLVVKVKYGNYLALGIAAVFALKINGRVGDWKDNLTLFQTDIQKVPNSLRANSALAFELYEKALSTQEVDFELLEKSAEYFREGINIYGNNASAWYNYGLCNLALGDYTMAEICFKESLRVKPDQTMAFNNMGNISYLKGEHEEAKLFYLKAIELDDANAEAWSNLGAEYLLGNKNDSAFYALSKALQLDPTNENAQYNHTIAKKRVQQILQ